MKLTKNPVLLHYFSKLMGILLFVLKYMFISLHLKMINEFSWSANIMASPFNIVLRSVLRLAKVKHVGPIFISSKNKQTNKQNKDIVLDLHVPILSFSHPFVFRPMGSPLLELSTSGWVIFYLSVTGTLHQCLFIYTTLYLALTSYSALSDMNGSSGLS